MGISPEHRPPLRPRCSRSGIALNGPDTVTDLIPPGPAHHLRQLHEADAAAVYSPGFIAGTAPVAPRLYCTQRQGRVGRT